MTKRLASVAESLDEQLSLISFLQGTRRPSLRLRPFGEVGSSYGHVVRYPTPEAVAAVVPGAFELSYFQ